MSKQTTLFPEYIEKYFFKMVGKITEKYNGENAKPELLFKKMTTEEYSADMTWGSSDINNVIVAADVVSMDASVPLKKRGKLSTASGKIAKIGIGYRKGETDITDLNIAKARGADEATIAAKVLNDVPRVIEGTDARIEIMFEQALSTGEMLVEGDDKNATGVRVKFYKDKNSFENIGAPWDSDSDDATPQDDLQQLFDQAEEDSNNIALVMMSKKYFNLFRKSRQGKELAATYQKRIFSKTTVLPVPSRSEFLDALADEYGAEFRLVSSSFRVQRNDGETVAVHPWEEANIVGLPSEKVGRVVYGTLAEETNPVAKVDYQKSGSYLLISKFSDNNPLEEWTTGQAMALPVIDGAESIYLLKANVQHETPAEDNGGNDNGGNG